MASILENIACCMDVSDRTRQICVKLVDKHIKTPLYHLPTRQTIFQSRFCCAA